MPQQLIPNTYRYNSAKNFVDSFSKTGVDGNHYYVFAGNHQDYINSDISIINDDTNDTYVDVYRNMIFGKLAQPEDAALMIRRVEWNAGVVYDMYDDKDSGLYSKNFFVFTTDGSYYYVFKCLNNNNGGASTVQPTLTSVGDDSMFISPQDNYVWKYMYSVDSSTFSKFSNDTFMPYVANSVVINSAVAGSIDSVKIIGIGAGYGNYIVNGAFSTSDIGVYSNSQNYGISVAGASNIDDYYEGCVLVITSGTGRGQYRIINQYQGTTGTKYAILESAFDTIPDNTSTYSIYPGVYIVGDQTQSVNAVAWAYINPTGNTVSRVEMLERGAGYKIASANVYSSPYVNPTSVAEVRPVVSPPGGHGASPANELYCNAAAVSVQFKNNEGNTIPVTNQFRQVGLLLNPTFSNVTIDYTSSIGTFVAGEYVYNFYPKRVQTGISIDIANNILSVDETTVGNGAFDTLLETGQLVYVVENSTHQLYTINAISNSSQLIINSYSPISIANGTMYTLDIQAEGVLSSSTTNQFGIMDMNGRIKTDAIFVGNSSGAYTNTVTSILINDQAKDQSTFIQAYRYTGTVTSGTFQNNEVLTQFSNAASNGILHSVYTIGGTTNFYVTNQNGIFNTSNSISGATSKATASLTNKYLPELVFGSGQVLYLENLSPIARANNQTETFKLIFEF
jgi:hypothetical protein